MKQHKDNTIKLAYQAPTLSIDYTTVESPLLANSIVINSSSPVENEEDIGFVKEESVLKEKNFDSEGFWE